VLLNWELVKFKHRDDRSVFANHAWVLIKMLILCFINRELRCIIANPEKSNVKDQKICHRACYTETPKFSSTWVPFRAERILDCTHNHTILNILTMTYTTHNYTYIYKRCSDLVLWVSLVGKICPITSYLFIYLI